MVLPTTSGARVWGMVSATAPVVTTTSHFDRFTTSSTQSAKVV